MITVHEVSRMSGVSVRSLHYYDEIGLLPAAAVTAAGYRLYDERALARLQMILLYKELQFPLKEIARILDDPGFDREKALAQQIELLALRKEHLEDLIVFAREIQKMGVQKMSKMRFDAFDTRKIDEYAAQAKAAWGETDAYREYEKRAAGRSAEEEKLLGVRMMEIFAEFSQIRDQGPASAAAQGLVKKLQDFISGHYYACTDAILESLGQMYAGGGEMTENIDRYAGVGTAAFANEAIEAYILGDIG